MRRALPLLAASLVVLLAGCAVRTAEPAPATPFPAEEGRSNVEEAALDNASNPAPSGTAGPVARDDLLLPGPAASAAAEGIPAERIGSAKVPVRRYEPEGEPWGSLVWAHGGSFVHGNLDWPESDWVSTRFAEAGLRVYAVDYALASDRVKAPAPANDVTAALRWALANEQGPVAIGGASAGGHLAAEAALAVSECPANAEDAEGAATGAIARPVALLLQYPTLHRVQRPDARIAALTAGLEERRRFGPERVAGMYGFYLGDEAANPGPAAEAGPCRAGYRVVPRVVGEATATELAQLPPTIIVNAEADDLRASAEQFAEQLDAAAVPRTSFVQPGTIHGYLNRPETDAASRAAAQQTIDTFVAELRRVVGATAD